MDSGQLAESDLVIRLMHSAFTKLDYVSTSVLIDGFPRKVSELNRWTELTSKPDFVIICECDEDVRMRRLLGRRICKSCGAGYNMHEDSGLPVIKTRVSGRCDHCNGILVRREDDTAAVIATRTIIHEETEAPVQIMIEQILAPNRILRADMTNGPRIELLRGLVHAISSS
jgi:adenylate kinase